MGYGLYDSSVIMARDALKSLSTILKKGEAAPNAASLPEARIHPDMLPLTFQVYTVTDLAQKMLARVSGTEPLTLEKDLKTFADMHARIDQVLELLADADQEAINKRVDEIVPLNLGPNKLINVPARVYVNAYGLTNLFFHLVTAYDIMRKEGVPLGKLDYLGAFMGSHIPEGH
ncbi:hypothetical protein CDD81_6702 [Ophiocordyceps australis]|uniref:DUF1993 domain-containing protein n=1 Tax=Ophiocordyceps australis TaxID=1399860 RepID=A0A2C5Y5W1_9HYPO|nr:hypothetical protein CDD81_6702 [Ophiocordyceps australis]